MVEENAKRIDDEDLDLEPFLKEILGNRNFMLTAIGTIQKLTSSGAITAFNRLLDEYTPGDFEAVVSLFSSKELMLLLKKSIGTLSGIAYAFSRDSTSDTVQSILYNLDDVTESMVDGARNPKPMSILKLLSMMKDDEVASGLTAAMEALKALGRSLKKVNLE